MASQLFGMNVLGLAGFFVLYLVIFKAVKDGIDKSMLGRQTERPTTKRLFKKRKQGRKKSIYPQLTIGGHSLKRSARLFLLSVALLLMACQANDLEVSSRQEVIASLNDQGLSPKEQMGKWGKKVFGMKLNEVRPSTYELKGNDLYVYIYPSQKAREKGLDDWREKTASMDLGGSYRVYEAQNVLLFCVSIMEDLDGETDEKIQAAMDGLMGK